MARIRSIKPEFPQSESMGRVSRDARLTFIQLWTLADDEGRLRGNSRMLASLLFPYDDDAKDLIDGWLDELESEGCIQRYRVNGDSYMQIANWLIHQKIDKPSKSKIPSFDESSRILANPRGSSSLDQGKDQGSKTTSSTRVDEPPEGFAEFWEAYPRKVSKPQAVKTWRKLKLDMQALPAILGGIERGRQSAQWQRDDGQFIPHPATWLNGRRWEDEEAHPVRDANGADAPWAGAI